MEDYSLCRICGSKFNTSRELALHIRKQHNLNTKEYHDKFLKKDGEGKCLMCPNDTPFLGWRKGYQLHCCQKHANNNPNILVYDVKKRNRARDNNLNYVVLWSKKDIDEWISFNFEIRKDF